MSLSNPNVLAILFDWIGSVLMLGTVWGWLYSKISPKIKRRLRASERHLLAIERYIKIKYKADITHVPVVIRYMDYRKRIGLEYTTSIWSSIALVRDEKRIRRRLEQYGLASEEDKKKWEQTEADKREAVRLGLTYIWHKVTSAGQFAIFRGIDAVTVSLFTGRLAFVLFSIGFLLWNVAKVLYLSQVK